VFDANDYRQKKPIRSMTPVRAGNAVPGAGTLRQQKDHARC
jgi:hypothetical protein